MKNHNLTTKAILSIIPFASKVIILSQLYNPSTSAFTYSPPFTPTHLQKHHVKHSTSIKANLSWLYEEESSSSLIDKVSKGDEKLCALAKLAVAFSPPERQLSLKDILNVRVVNIDGSRIELVAELCEVDGCVSLFVPVEFPNYCGSDGMEECVLDNLSKLEEEAALRLREMTEEEEDAMNSEDDESLCAFMNELPSWWVRPVYNDADMLDECDTARKLLNEKEFQSEVAALAKKGLEGMDGGEMISIRQAKVCVVGPAGMMLNARVVPVQGGERDWIVEIPYRFDGIANDVSTMRAAVLGAVAAVSL